MRKQILRIGILFMCLGSLSLNAQTETSGREGVYRATSTKYTELKHTKLKVNFDYQKQTMNGEAWLTASPYYYSSDSLVLDAKNMLIYEVALEEKGTKKPLKYEYKENLLTINLGKVYHRNEDYTLYIKYTAQPKLAQKKSGNAFGDVQGLYFVNTQGKDPNKNVQIWTQGETENSSVWFPTIDKPNQKTTQEIYMTVPDQYVTLSNGILKEQKKEANGLRTDYWVMDKKHAPYLFFMGVGDYVIIRDKWRDIAVDYYVEKEYEQYAKQIFGMTPEMLDFFSKKLNYDFPWSKYAQIVGRDFISGAMENTTAVIHSEMANQKAGDLIDENRWESVIAHELFHHWFGDLVTTESWANLTVNESFANYSEYLWYEYKYGKDKADHHLMEDLSRYIHSSTDFHKNLVRFNYSSREDMFDLVSYNKGGGILHMLRNYVGDEAFFDAISYYLKTNEYGTGEAHQWRLALEKITGKDLNWFFNQWYFGSGNPKLSYSYTFEPVKKQITLSINQSQTNLFQFPLTLDIYEKGKPTRKKIWVEAKPKNDFIFSVDKNPDFINLNPDGILLAEIEDKKTAEQYLAQYTQTKDFYGRYKAVEKTGAISPKNEVAIKTLTEALKDSYDKLRIKALNNIDLTDSKQAKLTSQVVQLATKDPKTLVQAAAISTLAKTKDKKHLPIYEKGLNAVSNAVKSASLVGIASIDPSKVIEFSESIDLSNASEEVMEMLMPIIVKNKLEKHRAAIGTIVAFYPFIKFSNPELGTSAEAGFHWIMESDDIEATERITKVLGQAKSELSQNIQAQMLIKQMLQDGLNKKMQVLKNNPTSTTIHKQIDILNKSVQQYSE